MIRSYKTFGIVLNQRNYSEADRLLTIFTKTYGRLSLLAKSVRKPSSRKRGHLELFSLVKIMVIKTKGLDLISEAEAVNNFSHLRQNLNRIRIAYLFCELVNQLTAENQENESVYDLLLNSLIQLNSPVASRDLIISFEKKLLELLGFGLPTKLDRTSLENYISGITEKPLHSKKIV